MGFPAKHTEEETLLLKKYAELKKKKKLLQQQKQNKNKPAPEINKPQGVKRPAPEAPPSQEDAKELAKKVWAAKQAELAKQANRGSGFKRSRNLERKREVDKQEKAALPSFQPFSPGGGTAGGSGPGGGGGGGEEAMPSPGPEGGRKGSGFKKGLYDSFVSRGTLHDQDPRQDSEPKEPMYERRDRDRKRGNTIYVHGFNLTHGICEKAFKQFGGIANIVMEREKSCAFVTFDKMESADEAIKTTDGNVIGSVKLKVSMARRQPMLEAAADTTSPWGPLAAGINRGRHKDKREMKVYDENPFE